jgi:hypothetical protein
MKEMDTDASPHHHPADRAGATAMKFTQKDIDEMLGLVDALRDAQRILATRCYGPNWLDISTPLTNLTCELAEVDCEIKGLKGKLIPEHEQGGSS